MSTYVNITGGPDDVSAFGAQIKAKAAAFRAEAAGVLGDINGNDSGQPWGTDDPGKTFYDRQYHAVPEGGQNQGDDGDPGPRPPAEFDLALKWKLEHAGEPLDKLGDNVIQAMTGYQLTDADNATSIKTAQYKPQA